MLHVKLSQQALGAVPVNRVCLAYCVKCNSTLSAKHGTQNLSLSVCVDKRREPVIEQALKYFIF